jgi:hypothetical protein
MTLGLPSGQVWLLRIATALGLFGAAACGRAEEQNTAPPPTDAASAASTPRGVPGVTLTPHDTLAALLPDLAGWTRDPVQAATVNLPAPAAHARTAYSRGKARIDLEVTDTGGHPDYVGSLAKIAGTTFTQKASNGYMKGTTIGGHPAVESWNHVDRLGDVSVLIGRRVIVHATGTSLDSVETLRRLVAKVEPK